MDKNSNSHFALVLPGAVARGAYEAGVIEVLAEKEIKVDRIVATSSGALNGLAYAAGIRSGREREIAQKLSAAWVEEGGWKDSFDFNVWGLLRGRGVSGRDALLKMMHELVTPCEGEKKREIEFRIIVTPLNGVTSKIAHRPATTYEQVIEFSGKHFDTKEGLKEVFNAVTAACAFPGLFDPVNIPGLGPCVDGGAVNNAPIRYALQDSWVNRVIMPVPFPALMKSGEWKSGFGLLNHLIEILINERLFRDLKLAQNVNREADKLDKLHEDGVITKKQLDEIMKELDIRRVEVTEVRPEHGLKSGAFSGFFHKEDRVNLVQAGRKAALATLDRIPNHNPDAKQTT